MGISTAHILFREKLFCKGELAKFMIEGEASFGVVLQLDCMQPKHAVEVCFFKKKALQQTPLLVPEGWVVNIVFLIRDLLHAIGIRNFIWFKDLKSTAL